MNGFPIKLVPTLDWVNFGIDTLYRVLQLLQLNLAETHG